MCRRDGSQLPTKPPVETTAGGRAGRGLLGVTVIETTYAGTGGVLIGTGARWLLLDADPSPGDDRGALVAADPAGPGRRRDRRPARDAASPRGCRRWRCSTSPRVGWRARAAAPAGSPSTTAAGCSPWAARTAVPSRRLVGGVVTAGCARVREVAAPAPRRTRPTRLRGPLIDAVPAHILAASAPERDHDAGRLGARAGLRAPVGGHRRPARAGAPAAYVPRPRGTAGLRAGAAARGDPTTTADTTVRPPHAAGGAGGRTAASLAPPAHPTSETVLAVRCPAGHLTAAYTPECRVCHRPVPAQDPQRVPRPRLGALTLPTGEVVPLDRGVALGRKPRAVPGGEPYPHLVHLPAESTYLSRLHLQVELDGWLVLARDLGSPGRHPAARARTRARAAPAPRGLRPRARAHPRPGRRLPRHLRGRRMTGARDAPVSRATPSSSTSAAAASPTSTPTSRSGRSRRSRSRWSAPDVALNDRERALFTSEANAMARLGDHPNIVPVLTAGVTADNRPFLVMRYCPPPDLGVRVRHSPLSVADAISTGIKLASAVETAHRAGTVHRDIKPSNVLVTSYHEPALTDFGIAGRLQEVAAEDEVRISYPWSPPEMLDGRSNGSVASDVYSLGATIWHLLVGRSPFSITGGDNSARALSARILHAAPPATQRPDVPASLDRLLQQTMAKQPGAPPAERARPGARPPAPRGGGRLPAHPDRGRGRPVPVARHSRTTPRPTPT